MSNDDLKLKDEEYTAVGHLERSAVSAEDVVPRHGNHTDNAAGFLKEHRGHEAEITEAEERALVRRIDWRLMPIMCWVYCLNHTDKTQTGVAAVFGLLQDLQLSVKGPDGKSNTQRYSIASTLFFVGYIVGAYVLGFVAQKLPLAKCCGVYVILWGLVFLLGSTCTTYSGFYAARIFLGFMEGGIAPSFMLITGMWYRKEEQAWRSGLWYSAVGLAGIIPPPINYGITKAAEGMGVHQWKVLFYFWGGVTILTGFIVLWVLPDDQLRAKFMNDRERYVSIERLRSNQSGVKGTFMWYQVKEAILDVKLNILFLATFAEFAVNGLAITFAPIVINTLGFDKYQTTLLTMVSGGVAWISIIISSFYLRFKPNHRIAVCLIGLLPAILSFALLWKLPQSNVPGRLFGVWFSILYACVYAQIMGLATSNTAGYTKKLWASSLIFVGYCTGNIAAPLYFKGNEAPVYNSAMIATLICVIGSFCLICVYGFLVVRENRRRDRMGHVAQVDRAFKDLTDKENLTFRYST